MRKIVTLLFAVLVSFYSMSNISYAQAQKPTINVESAINIDSEIVNEITISDTEKMWIEGNTIYKMDIALDAPKEHKLDNKISNITTDAEVTIYSRHIDSINNPHLLLLQQYTIDKVSPGGISTLASQTKSDQAWDDSYTLKLTLSVNYSNQNNRLYLYSATGSYEQFARNGVSVESATLIYNASGKIYVNDKFTKNGSINGRYTSSGTFTNKTLSGSSTYIQNCLIAGVSYELKATRGVHAGVYLQIV